MGLSYFRFLPPSLWENYVLTVAPLLPLFGDTRLPCPGVLSRSPFQTAKSCSPLFPGFLYRGFEDPPPEVISNRMFSPYGFFVRLSSGFPIFDSLPFPCILFSSHLFFLLSSSPFLLGVVVPPFLPTPLLFFSLRSRYVLPRSRSFFQSISLMKMPCI